MKYIIPTTLIFLLQLAGCNSSIYEIVEVEEPVEIKEEVKPPVAETQEEIKEEPKLPDNKFTDKQVVSKNYVVQIGAFSEELNASKYTRKAKQSYPGEDIYYKDIDGLFKVRLGNFDSKTDAITMMEKLKSTGFPDSFVVELTYMKVEK